MIFNVSELTQKLAHFGKQNEEMKEEKKQEEPEPVTAVSVKQFMKNVCSKADLVFCLTVKGKSLSRMPLTPPVYRPALPP